MKNLAQLPLIQPDTLRWAVFVGLFCTGTALAQPALQPSSGPGGTPVINPAHGVPVIEIVPPNASGLSHNQFIDYNVGKPGLVLNNSLQSGQSQLAGALAANPQFHGHAASTILNEVVSRNASLIEGPQEIFGRAANYILANPNGITLNGGSFINTTRAGFAVGTAEVQDQQLKLLDTLQASGSLQVLSGGQRNDGGALDLIAPQIHSTGELGAKEDLNITVGRNRIDAVTGNVVEHLAATPSSIDAQLFGAMHAGRIRVVSTGEGAGVRVGAVQVNGRDGVSIGSAGDLLISGEPGLPATLRSEQGLLALQARDNLTLRAVDGQAKRIEAMAGQQLTLDATTRETIAREQENWDKGWWFVTTETYNRDRTSTERTLQGTTLQAEEAAQLQSGGDLRMVAATLTSAGQINLVSGGKLDIDAGVDSKRVEQSIRHRKHLWNGDSDRDDYQETARGSRLQAGQVSASATGAIRVRGSEVHSQSEAVLHSDQGSLEVTSGQTQSSSNSHSRDSKLFGLISKSKDNAEQHDQAQASEVQAQSNLHLASAEQMRVHGSRLKAGQQLKVDAKGDLLIDSAQSRSQQQASTHQRGLTASAKQTQEAADGKPASHQYQAGLGYQVVNSQHKQQDTTQLASELQAGSVDLRSDAHLQVNGSQVKATHGDLNINAEQTTLSATHNQHESLDSSSQSGGGLLLSGGIDKLGAAFEGHHNRDTQQQKDSKVQRSELSATGDLHINSQQLVTEAVRVTAGDTLQIDAEHIDNRAVHDTEVREHNRNDWSASLGGSLEYRGLTRPIEQLIAGGEGQRFQQASVEDALVAPSVGADMTVEHLKRLENQRRGYAQVGELSGGSVVLKADRIDDQGTAWRANTGTLQIDADRHHMAAAVDQQQGKVDRLAYGGDLRVDTSTGEDINVRASAKGDSLASLASKDTARPGSLYGKQGIQVQLGSEGRYEASRFDGGDAGVSLHSGGQLSLVQATDRHSEQINAIEGNAWAKGGNRPGSTGGEMRGYLKSEQRSLDDTTAQVAQIHAKGDVSLSSAGDLLLEGTRIGSRAAKVANVDMNSAGLLQVMAATSSHEAHGNALGGGLELSLKQGDSRGGAVGGHFNSGRVDESSRQAVDAQIDTTGKLALASSAREETAMHLQGLQATAGQITITADNGGLLLEGSSNSERRDNLAVTAGAGFARSSGSLDSQGLHGRVKVNLDRRDNQTWNTSNLRADHIVLTSSGDSRLLSARLDAGRINADIGGDLLVASRKDHVNNLSVDVDARLSRERNPQGFNNALAALAGPAGDKLTGKFGKQVSKIDPSLSPTLKLDVSQVQRDTVSEQASLSGRDEVQLKVGGNLKLEGAKLQSGKGQVEVQAASVNEQTLYGRDYRRDFAVDASNSPVDLGTALVDVIKTSTRADGENALNLGLLRTSGHDRHEVFASSIQDTRTPRE